MFWPLIFLSGIEPVIPDFASLLYVVFLHSTFGVGFNFIHDFQHFSNDAYFWQCTADEPTIFIRIQDEVFSLNLAVKYVTQNPDGLKGTDDGEDYGIRTPNFILALGM
jgi:hypothetical protein